MLIKSNEDYCDDDGELLFDNIIFFNWKDWHPDNSEMLAKELDGLGIDVVEYDTCDDAYVIRFVKREEN